MNRILLVDDSPHAQRIGERILTEEGFEVVTVSNADAALIRIEDVEPDVVIADAVMPGRTGYEICQYLKMNPRHRHVRVILTAGVLEPIDEARAQSVESDGAIRKPFEASALVNAVRPLAEAAARDRKQKGSQGSGEKTPGAPVVSAAPFVAVVDAEQVRAAVTVALDGAMEAMVSEISRRVVAMLQAHPLQPASQASDDDEIAANTTSAATTAAGGGGPALAPGAPLGVRPVAVTRVHPLRVRTSILGLDAETPSSDESRPESGPLAAE
jgi:CheY-like chemotaxis protein